MRQRSTDSRILSGFSGDERGVSLAIFHRLTDRVNGKIEVFSSLGWTHSIHPHAVKKLTDREPPAFKDELLAPCVWTRDEV